MTLLFNNIFTNRFSKNKMQKPSTKCKIIFFPTVYTSIISLVLGCRNLDYKFNVPYKMCAYQFLKKYLFWNEIYTYWNKTKQKSTNSSKYPVLQIQVVELLISPPPPILLYSSSYKTQIAGWIQEQWLLFSTGELLRLQNVAINHTSCNHWLISVLILKRYMLL